ncbi:hypothetical protein KUTeg_002215 [Tegillarca granosa]|uniref:Uncharacterized protein n=1 Tax=Tegillarca granosa TaxID=220873 RepID=A0ABQ9FTP0_TEGGR|nr:hypothetical protein KUTeg_002215 [Tegillarca granosa]
MRKYLTILIFACIIPLSVGILCYSCSDSSGDEGKNGCQVNIKTMSKHRREYEKNTEGSLWLKNCTNPNLTYCIIEKVESSGRVYSFIRECSDGDVLSYSKKDVPTLRNLKADNQTACGYIQSGFGICEYGYVS